MEDSENDEVAATRPRPQRKWLRRQSVTGAIDASENSYSAPIRSLGLGLVFGLLAISSLTGLSGWLGSQTYAGMQEQRQRTEFLEAGKQAAVKLTSISYTDADGDVKRILESATGPFSADFQKRSQPFIAMVKQVKSTTVGSVALAGLEDVHGDKARVLVAMSVKTTLGDGGEQPVRLWRMRIEVQDVGHETKVSNVEFVP